MLPQLLIEECEHASAIIELRMEIMAIEFCLSDCEHW